MYYYLLEVQNLIVYCEVMGYGRLEIQNRNDSKNTHESVSQ